MNLSANLIPTMVFILFNCLTVESIKPDNCEIKDIKYLTTYIDSRMWEVAGGSEKINVAAAKELLSFEDEEIMDSYWFIPFIMRKINDSNSDLVIDGGEKEVLAELSKVLVKIWGSETYTIDKNQSDKALCLTTNAIIDRYHEISEDDSQFYKLILTFDDGPFYGYDTNEELARKHVIEFDTFKLIIRGDESENTLELIENDKIKWRKVIARSKDYKIKQLDFANDPIRVNDDLGYKIALVGDAELIQLYLKKSGGFRLFFHSW